MGEVRRDPSFCGAELAPQQGVAFFCPICCEIWFRAISDGEPSTAYHRFCSSHSPGTSFGTSSLGNVWLTDIPGSLWRVEDREWNRALPPAALTYELVVTLKWLAALTADPEMRADIVEVFNSLNRSL